MLAQSPDLTDVIEVADCKPEDAVEWNRFVETSNNGTLFHDLDFLAYHPAGKFDARHLVFRREGQILALLPASTVVDNGKTVLRSPYGASVGGFVLPAGQPMETTLALVSRLLDYTRDHGMSAVEMRLAPSLYMQAPHDHLGFALFANGFQLIRRWLSPVIPLSTDPDTLLSRCAGSKVRDLQNGLRKGLWIREAGIDQVGEFQRLLTLTWDKHGVAPTHSREDVEELFRRLPGRIRLFTCEHEGQRIGAVLVFVLNRKVAYTFYICQDSAFRSLRPGTVLVLHLAQALGAEGVAFLDLGPVTFDDLRLNRGLASFKEELGGLGACRDTWRWEDD
jgi:hypothetical protein